MFHIPLCVSLLPVARGDGESRDNHIHISGDSRKTRIVDDVWEIRSEGIVDIEQIRKRRQGDTNWVLSVPM